MAAIEISAGKIVVISTHNIAAYCLGSPNSQKLVIEKPEKREIKGQPSGIDGSDRVLASALSKSGQYLALCDDYKQTHLWKYEAGTWTKRKTWITLGRRATAVKFTSSEEWFLMSDKSGDVHRFSVNDVDKEPELMAGHISMLMDLELLEDDAYLVTCDRDEKVRVSHYPNTHTIKTFCLGHQNFVTQLGYFMDEKLLVSGSGDGTLRLWNYQTGQEYAAADCTAHLPTPQPRDEEIDQSGESSESDGQSEDEAGSHKGQTEPVAKSNGEKNTETNNGDMANLRLTEGQSDEGQCQSEGQGDSSKTLKLGKGRCWPPQNKGADIKCVSCCQKQKQIAVSFDRQSKVLVYQLTSDRWLKLLHTLDAGSEVWTTSYDEQGRLWVLSNTPDKWLTVYDSNTRFSMITELDDITTIVNKVNTDQEFFKGAAQVESIFPVLHKAIIDNLTEYKERKKERIEKLKDKRKSKDTNRNRKRRNRQNREGQSKKQKS